MSELVSSRRAFLSLLNLTLGAGLLGTPAMIDTAGIWFGGVAVVVTTVVLWQASMLLVKAIDAAERRLAIENLQHKELGRAMKMSLEAMGTVAFGNAGTYVVSFLIFMANMGFCIGYVSFISNTMHYVNPDISVRRWVLLSSPALLLITQLRSVGYLSVPALISTITFVACLVIMILECTFDYKFMSFEEAGFLDTKDYHADGFIKTVAAVSYSYNMIAYVLQLRSKMAAPHELSKVITQVMSVAFLIYCTFSTLVLLCFSHDIESVITLNFKRNALNLVMAVVICVCMVIGYAQCLYPVSKIIDGLIDPYIVTRQQTFAHHLKRGFVRMLVHGINVFVVLEVPNFQTLLAFTGAVFSGTLCCVLPCVLYMKLVSPFGEDGRTSIDDARASLLAPSNVNSDDMIMRGKQPDSGGCWPLLKFYVPPVFYILSSLAASSLTFYYTL